MQKLGLWILLTFILYVILMLATKSKKENVVGALFLGGILALGFVLSI